MRLRRSRRTTAERGEVSFHQSGKLDSAGGVAKSGLGVTEVGAYIVKRLDHDYFGDDE